MYDEKVEIQHIFNRMKTYKMKRAEQNNLIHLLKHIKAVQSMVFIKDHTFKFDDNTQIQIDIEKDLTQTKLQLDYIFKQISEDEPRQEVADIHKQLGTVLQNIKKKMEQIKKQEEDERLRKEAEEKKKLEEEEKKKKNESGVESEDEEEKDDVEEQKNKKPNPNDLFKRQYNQRDLTIEKEELNKYELESKLQDSADSMKWIAKGVLVALDKDDLVRNSVGNKQDKQKSAVQLNSLNLGWKQLIFMLLISLTLTMFTLAYIHLKN